MKNKKILKEIADAAELLKKDAVLEVGPGTGTLTEILSQKAGKIIAVEKDKDLIPLLKKKFKDTPNVKIIHGDILKISSGHSGVKFNSGRYKIVANLPYYLTSAFLRKFLSSSKSRPKLMVLMLQREVADRIIAKNKKESLLSLSVKAYANTKIIRYVKRGSFSPPPKVDSAVIKISCHSGANLGHSGRETEKVLRLARLAFQKKRKMLRHSLGKFFSGHSGVKFNSGRMQKYAQKRPEELSLEDWKEITHNRKSR